MYEFWVTWTHDPVLSKSSILPTWNRKSRYVLKSVHAVMTNFVGEFHFTLRVGISDQVSRSNHFVKVTKRYVSSEHHRIAVTWPSLHRSTYFELSIEADVWNANLILTLDTSYYREWNNLIALPDSLKQNILKLHPCSLYKFHLLTLSFRLLLISCERTQNCFQYLQEPKQIIKTVKSWVLMKITACLDL